MNFDNCILATKKYSLKMAPSRDSSNKSIELDLPKERVTVNIDKLDLKVVNKLIGIKGNSKSSVICALVKEWISQNSEHIIKTWEIDLAGIRRQIIAEIKGVELVKELENYEKSTIEKFPELFEAAEEITVEEVAKMLKVNQVTIKKIVLLHNKELQNLGLNLKYKNEIIINKG